MYYSIKCSWSSIFPFVFYLNESQVTAIFEHLKSHDLFSQLSNTKTSFKTSKSLSFALNQSFQSYTSFNIKCTLHGSLLSSKSKYLNLFLGCQAYTTLYFASDSKTKQPKFKRQLSCIFDIYSRTNLISVKISTANLFCSLLKCLSKDFSKFMEDEEIWVSRCKFIEDLFADLNLDVILFTFLIPRRPLILNYSHRA